MQYLRRTDWTEDRSIVAERESGDIGQIIWRGSNPEGSGDVFLVRVGKDGSRTAVGGVGDAEEALKALACELKGGNFEVGRNIRLDTWLEKHFLPTKSRLKGGTRREYVRIVRERICPALGHHRIRDIRHDDIQAWVDELYREGLSKKTVKEYYTLLRSALRLALTRQVIKANPAEGVEALPPTRPDRTQSLGQDPFAFVDEDELGSLERVWSEDEMRRFVLVAPRDHEMTRWVLLALRTGLRPGEQCALTWRRVDLERGVMRIRASIEKVDKAEERRRGTPWRFGDLKTESSQRDVTLPPDALQCLREQRAWCQKLYEAGEISAEQAQFVFFSKGKNPFTNPATVKDRLRKFVVGRKDRASANGLPGIRYIPPYGLRHTHATDLLRHGWPLFNVSKRLGTSIAMLEQHYGHLLPDMEQPRMDDMTRLPGSAKLSVVEHEDDEAAGHRGAA